MRRQRYHGRLKRLFPVLGAAMLVWWRWRPFRVAVSGDSMAPTLQAGDWLIAVRTRSILPGMLVVVEHPERPGLELVKRVSAGPGERIADGSLGPDEYWVVGDNPNSSTDSRRFGPVHADAVRGRPLLRYGPVGRIAWLG